jgi:hypothetical protein
MAARSTAHDRSSLRVVAELSTSPLGLLSAIRPVDLRDVLHWDIKFKTEAVTGSLYERDDDFLISCTKYTVGLIWPALVIGWARE